MLNSFVITLIGYYCCSENKLTRQKIQAKITDLKMRLLQLQSMQNAQSPTDDDLKKLNPNTNIETLKKNIEDAAKAVRCYEYLCQAEKTTKKLPEGDTCKKAYPKPKPCDEVNAQRAAMNAAMQSATQAQTENDLMMNVLEAYRSSNTKEIADNLQAKIKALEEELKSAPTESPVVNKAKEKGEMIPQEIEQNWMSFSFDSVASSKSVSSNSKTYKGAHSFHAGGLLWSSKGGVSYSSSEQEFHKKMSSADVSVSAKLLRVTINRNWFRPSIFRISNFLKMVSELAER